MIYDHLGMRTVLNAVGPATRLGGLPLHPEVWQAMQESLDHSVRMDEFERAAGRRIAELLGVEAAYVTSGASAALYLATAAVMAQGDPARIDRLPDATGMRHRVIIQAAQRDPYDRAVEAAGARIVAIGYPDTTHPGELERAIDDTTAAVLFRPGRNGNLLELPSVCAIAHAAGIPVIVDGALFIPPIQRLRSYLEAGADLVAISGGKGFRGPQGSGLLVGRADLVDVVGLHHQDMDERDTTWPRGADGVPLTPPRHGIARSMKVGREQIAGLVAAVERYVRDPGADEAAGTRELDIAEKALRDHGGITVHRVHETTLDVPGLHLEVAAAGVAVDAFVKALGAHAEPVFVGESEAWRGVVTLNGMALQPGQGDRLAAALIEVLEELT